jgi:hypothetical protein
MINIIPVKKVGITPVEIRHAEYVETSIRKSWHQLRRRAAVSWSV